MNRDRESAARQFAAEHNVLIVLKGPGTIISDGDRLAVNSTGNSGMGTGGSGDVLTGLMAAVLAPIIIDPVYITDGGETSGRSIRREYINISPLIIDSISIS